MRFAATRRATARSSPLPATEPTVHRRALVRFPTISDLPVALRERLSQAQLALANLDRDPCRRIQQIAGAARIGQSASDQFAIWSHPLSEHAVARTPDVQFKPGRSTRECAVLRACLDAFAISLTDGDEGRFVELLQHVAGEFNGAQIKVRTGAVGTRADSTGARVLFPQAPQVLSQLAAIRCFLRDNLRQHPLLSAVIAMVALVNCHPFNDGNGRTSRTMFNAVLQHSGALSSSCYVPLYECFWLSRRGWEIRVRIVETVGDWEPVLRYVADVISVISTFSRAHLRQTIRTEKDLN